MFVKRIGLIRHFPVEHPFPRGWRTAAELVAWLKQYDVSPAIVGSAKVDVFPWTECISSDMERAFVTAKTVFAGPIERTMLLREPDFEPFATGDLRLPVLIWRWLLQLSWVTGHKSQRTCRDRFRRRVVTMADLLETKAGNTLVVSHAGMMAYLSAELRRRNYTGPKLGIARHATLYCYEKCTATGLPKTPDESQDTVQ
jgi:broad specificity phosphatase PhoE